MRSIEPIPLFTYYNDSNLTTDHEWTQVNYLEAMEIKLRMNVGAYKSSQLKPNEPGSEPISKVHNLYAPMSF